MAYPAPGRGGEERVHTYQSPFAGTAQEPNLLSHSELLQATNDHVQRVKEQVEIGALVAYEFLQETHGDWRWSVGQIREFSEHTVTILKWRCEHGNNADLVEVLRRDQVAKARLLKETSQSIFAVRAELCSVRSKNEADMAGVRSELESCQKPLSVADDALWTAVLSAAGSGRPAARGLLELVTAVVRLVDQRGPTETLTWREVQKASQQPFFLDRLYHYDVWYDMSTDHFKCTKALLEENSDLQTQNFQRSTQEIAPNVETQNYIDALYFWLKAQVQAFTTYLGCASTQEYANSLQQQLFDCVQNLKDLNRKMAQIKEELEIYTKGSDGMSQKEGGVTKGATNTQTFVPTNGIVATLLRSSIILVLRDKSSEVAVLDSEDINEIALRANHHRPALHTVIAEQIQSNVGHPSDGKESELEALRRRNADLQAENEALREENGSQMKEVQSRRERSAERALKEKESEAQEEKVSRLENELQKLTQEKKAVTDEKRALEEELRKEKNSKSAMSNAPNQNAAEEVKNLKEENRKLRDELREVEREKRKLEREKADAPTVSRGISHEAQKALEERAERAQAEARDLRRQLREAEGKASESRRDKSAVLSLEMEKLILQEKCGRFKLESTRNHRWANLIMLDRDVMDLLRSEDTQVLLEELDAQASNYTDSLEKLETLIAFIEEARNGELKLRKELSASEEKLFSLQRQCDSMGWAGATSGGRPRKKEASDGALVEPDYRRSYPSNEATASFPKGDPRRSNSSRGQPSSSSFTRPPAYSVAAAAADGSFPVPSARRFAGSGAALPESSSMKRAVDQDDLYARMREEMEQIKKEREALACELGDRTRELDSLNRRAVTQMGELTERIAAGQKSTQRMKGAVRRQADYPYSGRPTYSVGTTNTDGEK